MATVCEEEPVDVKVIQDGSVVAPVPSSQVSVVYAPVVGQS